MEQVQLVVKNLQGPIKKHLIVQPLTTFQQLYVAAIQIKDAIRSRILDRGEHSVCRPKKFGNNPSSNPNYNSQSEEFNAINTHVLQNPSPRGRRNFTPFNISLSKALDRLVAAKHLTLL